MSCSVQVLCVQERSGKEWPAAAPEYVCAADQEGAVAQERCPNSSPTALVSRAPPANSLQRPQWLWLVPHTTAWNLFHFCCSGQPAAPPVRDPLIRDLLCQGPPRLPPPGLLLLGAGGWVQNWGCWPDNHTHRVGPGEHKTQEPTSMGPPPKESVGDEYSSSRNSR